MALVAFVILVVGFSMVYLLIQAVAIFLLGMPEGVNLQGSTDLLIKIGLTLLIIIGTVIVLFIINKASKNFGKSKFNKYLGKARDEISNLEPKGTIKAFAIITLELTIIMLLLYLLIKNGIFVRFAGRIANKFSYYLGYYPIMIIYIVLPLVIALIIGIILQRGSWYKAYPYEKMSKAYLPLLVPIIFMLLVVVMSAYIWDYPMITIMLNNISIISYLVILIYALYLTNQSLNKENRQKGYKLKSFTYLVVVALLGLPIVSHYMFMLYLIKPFA